MNNPEIYDITARSMKTKIGLLETGDGFLYDPGDGRLQIWRIMNHKPLSVDTELDLMDVDPNRIPCFCEKDGHWMFFNPNEEVIEIAFLELHYSTIYAAKGGDPWNKIS